MYFYEISPQKVSRWRMYLSMPCSNTCAQIRRRICLHTQRATSRGRHVASITMHPLHSYLPCPRRPATRDGEVLVEADLHDVLPTSGAQTGQGCRRRPCPPNQEEAAPGQTHHTLQLACVHTERQKQATKRGGRCASKHPLHFGFGASLSQTLKKGNCDSLAQFPSLSLSLLLCGPPPNFIWK